MNESTLSEESVMNAKKAIEALGEIGVKKNMGIQPEPEKSFFDLVAEHTPTVAPPPEKPLLSIVVMFDEANEKRWMKQFLERLPNLPESSLGLIEVISCKNEKGEEDRIDYDGEYQIAKNLIFKRCKFTYTDWRFDLARNSAKRIATGDWILSLDSDEYIDKYQLQKIIDFTDQAAKNVGGIYCTVISHVQQEVGYGLEAVQKVCRLFRNSPEFQWRSRVHEFIDYSIREENGFSITDSTITIMHDGYEQTDLQGILDKFQRNYLMLCKELLEPYSPSIAVHALKYSLITASHIRELTGI